MKYEPHAYQRRATDFVIDNRYCALFLDMGLGKTVATLTALDELVHDYLEAQRILVIAPKSVAQNTWSSEASKWDHLKDMRISVVMGTPAQREKALQADADIYVINRDLTTWIVMRYIKEGWPFDTVVLDESSSFKNPASKRFKALRKVRPFIRRLVELTGTPSPNGLMDLWAQAYLIDRGKRLGPTLTAYRHDYFREGRRNGAVVYEWIPRPGSRERITRALADVCLSMQAADYLELPDFIQAGTDIALPPDEFRAYQEFEREQVMQLEGEDIQAVTAAALTNKLLQFTGGSVYDEDHHFHEVSRAKLEALEDIIESTDEPVLVYYAYQSEKERILETLRSYKPETFSGEPETLARWNSGQIRVLIAHPASVAYGLNMQQGGHIIVWYTPTWNLEQYQQANARLYRQGQEKPVLVYELTAIGTVDERVRRAIGEKGNTQTALLQYIKSLRNAHNMSKNSYICDVSGSIK